jgi:dihydroflavonol-4-reductase
MEAVLVTGATGFLGYHLVKQLNERGIRPRALVRRPGRRPVLDRLDVEVVPGDIEDAASLPPALAGVQIFFHLAGLVSTLGADRARLRRVNVEGTRHVLATAHAAGVKRVVVTSSVAAVGTNRIPEPLDEEADWDLHGLDYPYAATKRAAEAEALEWAARGLPVVVVNPSIVLGPEDFAPTSGGQHLKELIERRIPGFLPMGVSYVDVRDVAAGQLLAAEKGRPGQRYILSAHNLTLEEFYRQACAIAGVPPPRWRVPLPLAYAGACVFEGMSALTGRPPRATRDVLRVAHRFSWFDARRARQELGWTPRPLQETLEDAIRWFRGRR